MKDTGRSLSEEIEWRIERSFEWQDAFRQADAIIQQAEDISLGNLDAVHHVAGHKTLHTFAGTVWAETEAALDALVLPGIKRAVKEALDEAGLTKAKAE